MKLTSMTPTPEQETVFTAIANSSDNLMIEAVAGSGKTTTIIEGGKRADTFALFLAFNKSIASELEAKLPRKMTAKTFHGLCLDALRRSWDGKFPRIKGNKLYWLAKDNSLGDPSNLSDLLTLTSLAKNYGHGYVPDALPLQEIAEHHQIDLVSGMQSSVETLLELSNSERSCLDFDDMLLWTLDPRVEFSAPKVVYVDEAQDTNFVQRKILEKLSRRVIAVGDPMQAIYGFRGADDQAIANLISEFSMKTYPLSVSWRCSKAVVKEAQKHYERNIQP